jgi:hypothetical protein
VQFIASRKVRNPSNDRTLPESHGHGEAGHALSAVCVAAMGGSHPLAKRVGAWPAVAAVTGVTVAAAGAVTCTAGR